MEHDDQGEEEYFLGTKSTRPQSEEGLYQEDEETEIDGDIDSDSDNESETGDEDEEDRMDGAMVAGDSDQARFKYLPPLDTEDEPDGSEAKVPPGTLAVVWRSPVSQIFCMHHMSPFPDLTVSGSLLCGQFHSRAAYTQSRD